ncbi:MAG: YdeI/OmpD-associated family protein [Herbiconiux sp.]|nr:YdeI/OmpD-associated family protein [Herbiconiux sp.]
MADEYEQRRFADAEAWEAWLEEHAETVDGVRLVIAKKGSAHRTVSYVEALDVALCHGWIDARRNALDTDFFLQTFTRRRAKSIWSQVNQGKVAALIEAGRMREGGRREIDRAKADGRWDAAYASQSTIEVPADLAEALAADPAAQAAFAALGSQERYALLFRLHHLKRADTRARRIAAAVDALARPPHPEPPARP